MTENVVYWAVKRGSKSLEECLAHQGLLYNITKIECPFKSVRYSGPEYMDITELNADWYKGFTYFHQFMNLDYLWKKYGNELLFWASSFLDTDIGENLLEKAVKAEEDSLRHKLE